MNRAYEDRKGDWKCNIENQLTLLTNDEGMDDSDSMVASDSTLGRESVAASESTLERNGMKYVQILSMAQSTNMGVSGVRLEYDEVVLMRERNQIGCRARKDRTDRKNRY